MKTGINIVIFLLSSIMLTISSCDDKKDNDDNNARDPRVNEVWSYLVENSPYSVDSSVMYVSYNEKNLAGKIYDSTYSLNFQYSDDGRISQLEMKEESDSVYSVDFIWEGSTVTLTETDSPEGKLVFELNADGFITRMNSYLLIEQHWILHRYSIYNWENNNLVTTELWEPIEKKNNKSGKRRRFLPSDLSAFSYQFSHQTTSPTKGDFYKSVVDEYTYDNKNNPYRDFQAYWFTEIGYYRSANNVTSSTSTVYQTDGQIDGTYQTELSLTYNQDNYLSERLISYEYWSYREAYFYE